MSDFFKSLFVAIVSLVLAQPDEYCTTAEDAQEMIGSALLQASKKAGFFTIATDTATQRDSSQTYMGSPFCLSEERQRVLLMQARKAKNHHKTLGSVVVEEAPLDSSGFKEVTSLCCPWQMETFFTRLLESKQFKVCSKPHIQGLMHWFACVPAMDIQYVLDVIKTGNPCKYWAPLDQVCPVLSSECQGTWCGGAPTTTASLTTTSAPATTAAPTSTVAPTTTAVVTTKAPPITTVTTAPPTTSAPPVTTTTTTTTAATTTTTSATITTTSTSTTTPTTPTTTRTTTQVVAPPIECNLTNATQWDFFNSALINNNLGGVDKTLPANLHFSHLASGVDLVISNMSTYMDSATSHQTGKTQNGKFGQINQRLGQSTEYNFQFLDHDTQQPKTIEEFYFTFYDIDQFIDGKNWEKITLSDYDSWLVEPDNELLVSPGAAGGMSFRSTMVGWGCDNPQNPENLGDWECCDQMPMFSGEPCENFCPGGSCKMNQRKRAVLFVFKKRQSFKVHFETAAGVGDRGRNFAFAGKSNLIDLCPPSAR